VLPFMNFRLFGVLIAAGILSYVVLAAERWAARKNDLGRLAFLCIVASATPHFLWYGEKYGLNAIIIWLVLRFAYSCSMHMAPRRRLAGQRVDFRATHFEPKGQW